MFCYCVACQVDRCAQVAYMLEARGVLRAFSPQVLQHRAKEGRLEENYQDLLPGYVFVYSENELTNLWGFRDIEGINRWLRTLSGRYELELDDFDFAMNLYDKNGILGKVKMVKIGDEMTVDDPVFRHVHGTVGKIDWRKKRARVDFIFHGMPCSIWTACELPDGDRRVDKT